MKIECAPTVGACLRDACTTVSIDTSLGDDAKAEAKSICDTAAKAAYVDDINSIRVLSATGTELSQGIKGAGCL